MTICEAICMADKLRPNDVDRKTKAFWLVRLDEQIRLEMGEKFRPVIAAIETWGNEYILYMEGEGDK